MTNLERAREFLDRRVVLDPRHSMVPEALSSVLRAEETEVAIVLLAAEFRRAREEERERCALIAENQECGACAFGAPHWGHEYSPYGVAENIRALED